MFPYDGLTGYQPITETDRWALQEQGVLVLRNVLAEEYTGHKQWPLADPASTRPLRVRPAPPPRALAGTERRGLIGERSRKPPRRGRGMAGGVAPAAGILLAVVLAAVMAPALWRNGASCDSGVVTVRNAVKAAARTGANQGLRVAVAVVVLTTGSCQMAGDTDEFATASVVKVMIAAKLLASGQMAGQTARLAYSMITRSDDDAADVLWVQAGGTHLEPWVEDHYDLPDLGSPNDIPGRWGNTHVTALGLARLYAKLRDDPVVWPWLGDAMHHTATVAKDGTDQVFGLAALAPTAAVKQGWANGSADDPEDAVVNSTGYLAAERYAVVLLTEGRGNVSGCNSHGFHAGQAAIVTAMAHALSPALTG